MDVKELSREMCLETDRIHNNRRFPKGRQKANYKSTSIAKKTAMQTKTGVGILSGYRSKWIEVKNTHEPIIDEETFKTVQKELSVKRRQKVNHAPNIVAGRIKCVDCGKALHINFSRKHNNLSCATYKRLGSSVCTMHHILYKDVYDARQS